MAYAGGGALSVLARGRELLAGLGACQRAAGSGFLSAWPSRVLDTLEAGQFGDVWAPWYTLHKILAGLLDWCAHAGLQPEALQAAARGPAGCSPRSQAATVYLRACPGTSTPSRAASRRHCAWPSGSAATWAVAWLR